MIFGVDNSSSSHSDNRKNNFLVLGEGPTFRINVRFCSPEKKFQINFSNFIFVNGEETFKFKIENKNVNFRTKFCLGSISNGFSTAESREVSINGNVNDFLVDYNSIDKYDISNIHKYLMIKNNIK